MDYLLLKALHITAATVWIGGMVLSGLVLSFAFSPTSGSDHIAPRLLAAAGRWDRLVTSPAMGLAWAAGIGMAVWYGWFSSPWLMVKLAIVIALSALHGMQAGALRRIKSGVNRPLPAVLAVSGPLAIGAVLLIVILAITKPL